MILFFVLFFKKMKENYKIKKGIFRNFIIFFLKKQIFSLGEVFFLKKKLLKKINVR